MLMRRCCLLALSAICSLVVGMTLNGFPRPVVARAETTITIHITGSTQPPGFLPALLSVHVHDTVVFLNDATPLAPYSVVASDQSFASPPIAPGQQWTTTFTTPGVYDYTDPAYASQMFGELVVVPASVQLLPTPQPGAVATALAKDQTALASAPTTTSPATHPQRVPFMVILAGLGGLLLVGSIVLVLLIRARHRQKAATRPARPH